MLEKSFALVSVCFDHLQWFLFICLTYFCLTYFCLTLTYFCLNLAYFCLTYFCLSLTCISAWPWPISVVCSLSRWSYRVTWKPRRSPKTQRFVKLFKYPLPPTAHGLSKGGRVLSLVKINVYLLNIYIMLSAIQSVYNKSVYSESVL